MKVLKVTTIQLPCHLIEAELIQVGRDLAFTVKAKATEEAEQKSAKEQMKARISELEARQTRLSTVINSGMEYRGVEVELRIVDASHIQEVRLDTGEVMLTRPPLDNERQQCLPEPVSL